VDSVEHANLDVLTAASASQPEPPPPAPWAEGGPAAYQPAPSPDGTKIAFVSIQDDASQIFVANAEGSDVRQVTQGPTNKSNPSWSPDGEQIVFSAEGEDQNDLFVVNADGTGQRPITLAGNSVTPAWNPTATAPEPTQSPEAPARCLNDEEAAADPSLRKRGSLPGDVDGDGDPDHVFVAVDPQGEAPCRYFLIVEASGTVKAARIDPGMVGPDDDALALEALVEMDDRPGLEIVVDVWHGAATEFAAVFAMREGIPTLLGIEGFQATEDTFAYGGSLSAWSGVDCTGKAGILVVSGAHREGNGWVVERRFYSLEDSEFRLYEQAERHRLSNQELETSSLEERFPEFEPIAFPSCPGAVRAGGG